MTLSFNVTVCEQPLGCYYPRRSYLPWGCYTTRWDPNTWDQGKEMGRHVQFSVDTGVQVFFCDPKSPWQRGSNENTNGLVRQYLPKRTDLRPQTQQQLDVIAAEIQRTSSQDAGVHDTIREVRGGCCSDPLSPHGKARHQEA